MPSKDGKMRKIVLILEVTEGILHEDLITDINTDILCRLEEDDKKITGWEWVY
jgi:hypothetical protein